jgi:hypothetical protein
MSDKYRFEELDRETRDYLLLVREREGKGLPGIYVGKSDSLPVVGIVLGFVVLLATVLMTVPPTDPPAKEAMLQTAGVLLGGWMIIAAFRVWASGKSGRYAGQFVYADPDCLYEASGSGIEVTELCELRDAKAVQNFNEGKYQNTSITLTLGRDRKRIQVNSEERGRRLTVYLNAVAYMRDGGEDGKDESLRKLSPEAMGAVARQVAATGEFPTNPSRVETESPVRVPQPRRDGRASSGVLGMALIVLIGAGLFLGFLAMNYPFRDEAVFARIKDLPDKEQPPALRFYLDNEKFTAHRDEAKQLLAARYEAGVAANINGADPDLKRGLAEIVRGLKDKPTGVLSFRAIEEVAPKLMEVGTASRQKAVAEKLADKWGSTIGDELVVFAALEDGELPANIDLRWKFNERADADYTIVFRTSPDAEPLVSKSGTIPSQPDANRTTESLAEQILSMTVGMTKIRPVPPPEDF